MIDVEVDRGAESGCGLKAFRALAIYCYLLRVHRDCKFDARKYSLHTLTDPLNSRRNTEVMKDVSCAYCPPF